MNADILGIVSDHLCRMGDLDTACNVLSIDRHTYTSLQAKRDAVVRKCRFLKAKHRLEYVLSSLPSQTRYITQPNGYMAATRRFYKGGVYIEHERQVYGRDCCFEHMVMLFGEVSTKFNKTGHLVRAKRGMEYNLNTGEKADATWHWTKMDKDTFVKTQKDMDARKRNFTALRKMFSFC